jgi:hypothetical protein
MAGRAVANRSEPMRVQTPRGPVELDHAVGDAGPLGKRLQGDPGREVPGS